MARVSLKLGDLTLEGASHAGDETWFEVGPQDVFPEQFEHFLGMNEGLKRHFMDSHGDLLTPRFWRECQRRAARQAA